MKINRMLEIIIVLITEGEVKAKDLAERFNCTTKTIYRDVEYIKEAGIPIISEKGRNGGFKIGSEVSKNEGRISLKEQHAIINTLKNHGSISEEQMEEIMTAIEGLFKDNNTDWIDVEFEDSKVNNLFHKLKEAIINSKIVELFFKTDEELKEIRVEPYQIFIGDDGLYLRFFNLNEEEWDEISLKKSEGIEVLGDTFIKRNYMGNKQ